MPGNEIRITIYLLVTASPLALGRGCDVGTWSCHDGRRCIAEIYVCDKIIHCTDGSDEKPGVCTLWQCPVGSWKCLNHNYCILETDVCDGEDHCLGGADETDELCSQWNCTRGMWKCSNNICIPSENVCDNNDKCGDGSDELPDMCLQWNCTSGRWKCRDNLQCIPDTEVCDYWGHCADRSDEAHCSGPVCPTGTWKCKDGSQCVNNKNVCNRRAAWYLNCRDNSNKEQEFCQNNHSCLPGYWKCGDGMCIKSSYIMDGRSDCQDQTDENLQYHTGRTCPDGWHMCDNNWQCIQEQYWCDGRTSRSSVSIHCRDKSDEGSHCEHWHCHEEYWKCKDNLKCIPTLNVCDGKTASDNTLRSIYGCDDGSDEHKLLCGCPEEDDWPCDICVSSQQVCDGISHCMDKSDEFETLCLQWNCTQGMWKCYDNRRCVFMNLLCDGEADCMDVSDELECFSHICITGTRKCADNLQCVDENKICDGVLDCQDGSDELCNAKCLASPSDKKTIIKRCKEDISICFPVEQFCDRVGDCPHGSDEADSGCTCEDWNLFPCWLEGSRLCLYPEWLVYDQTVIDICENEENISNNTITLAKSDVTVVTNFNRSESTIFPELSLTPEDRWHTNVSRILIMDSLSVLASNSSHVTFITVSNMTLEYSIIIFDNIVMKFVECIFQTVDIEDSDKSMMEIREKNIQVILERCTFLCQNNYSLIQNGIKLNAKNIISLFIEDTVLKYCKINIFASGLKLQILKSSFLQTAVKTMVGSYLRVPTLISLLHTEFVQNESVNRENIILFDLHNAHLIVNNCTFQSTSMEITSKSLQFNQDLFLVHITDAYFVGAFKNGNGGAVQILSNLKNSTVVLFRVTFVKNVVHHSLSTNSGKGGAIFVEGQSLFLTVEDCVFVNNSAANSGSGLFTSQGVTVTVKNSSFNMQANDSDPSTVLSILGKVSSLSTAIIVEILQEFSTMGFNILQVEGPVNYVKTPIQCPAWHTHLVEYQVLTFSYNAEENQSIQSVKHLMYECGSCSENYYTTSGPQNIISFSSSYPGLRETPKAKQGCIPCPYGAVCSGNNVIPRPNYWGYWHEGEVVFQQCPAGYCCSGNENAPCTVYNSCAGNRTDVLCGACQEGFSVSILTGECTADRQCGGDQWFWLFAFLATIAYAMWYTFKDDIFVLFFNAVIYFGKIFTSSRVKNNVNPTKVTVKENVLDSLPDKQKCQHSTLTHSSSAIPPAGVKKDINMNKDGTNVDDIDKGYFGIITYYVQMASIITIHIEFSDVGKSPSLLDKSTSYIKSFLSIELRQMSFNICPVVGMTTLGKLVYNLIFFLSIHISWFSIFSINYLLIQAIRKKGNIHNSVEKLKIIHSKLIRGMVEIIKYTYAGFCGLIFMSLTCVHIGEKYVWLYDATHVCLGRWQIFIVIFALFFAIPFPVALFLGMKLLKQNQISAKIFLCFCLCPLICLSFMLVHKYTSQSNLTSSQSETTKESEAIISVLQGPYRQDDKSITLYWEAMVSIRRLSITAMTLVSYTLIRLIVITILCIAYFGQQTYYMPFQSRTSNHAESLSLLLLSIVSVINLLKASLTDSGVVPSGPSVTFFKGIELCEKMFVFIILVCILIIEIKLWQNKRKRGRNE